VRRTTAVSARSHTGRPARFGPCNRRAQRNWVLAESRAGEESRAQRREGTPPVGPLWGKTLGCGLSTFRGGLLHLEQQVGQVERLLDHAIGAAGVGAHHQHRVGTDDDDRNIPGRLA